MVAAGMAAAEVVYAAWVRPRLLRWGATNEEVTGAYPGAELVPHGQRAATMAVTIDAPPDQVWPWLVQMGGDRGGWYSWDRLDNGGRPSATTVHPEWQDLALGDSVKYWTRNGPVDAWEVAALEPNRFLGAARVEGSARPPARPRATTAIRLYRRAVGLPAERAAWRGHTPGHQRLPGPPPSVAGALRRLLALHPGCLADAGPHAGRAQTQHRTSGPGPNAHGPLRTGRLA